MAEPLLRLEGVQTHIGRYHILHGVDLSVPEAEVTMLLGRNGAGKTTTLRTIMGLWHASAGRITFAGQDITAWPTPEIARLGIAYVPETMAIFGGLTVHENIRLATRAGRFDTAQLDNVFALFPILKTKWHDPAGSLSGGQKQMLAISRAIAEPRRLLVIDEPTKGLAPAIIDHLITALTKINTTILLVEQNVHMAQTLGDTVTVMDDGRTVHTGTMADLSADEPLQNRLLGLSLASHQ